MAQTPREPLPAPPPMPADTLPAIDWLLQYYIPANRKSPKLLAAIERYKQAASTPPAIEAYIDSHLKDGLTPDEWTIFTAGLALRVMPTLGDLFGHETDFQKGGLRTHARTANYTEEAGDGKKLQPHPLLYFNSLRVLDHKLGVTTTDDAAVYTMLQQIMQLRRLNPPVLFPPITDAPNNITPKMTPIEAELQRLRDVSSPAAGDAVIARQTAFERFKREVPKINNGRALTLPYEIEGMDGSRLPKNGSDWIGGTEHYFGPIWFAKACEIAAHMPDDTINYYEAVNAEKNPHHPNDALYLLTRELNTLTREANASTHIGTYDRLLRAHSAYFGRDAKQALLWSDIHVNPKYGVEKGHEIALVTEFISMLRKDILNKQIEPDMLAQVFDHVVDQGYIAQQKHHWEQVVSAMARARAASKQPPIKPMVQGSFVDKLKLEGLANNVAITGWTQSQ